MGASISTAPDSANSNPCEATMKCIEEMYASNDRSRLLRDDVEPAESEPCEDCTPLDCTPPVVEPGSVASALIVCVCIAAFVIFAVVTWAMS